MFNNIRKAYGAGYRAGRAAGVMSACPPYYGRLACFLWLEGWEKGIRESIDLWLKERALAEI